MGASKKKILNEIQIKLPSLSVNESVARLAVASFVAQTNPSATELADIKCAVSEAVTNCIVHAYKDSFGYVYLKVRILEGGEVRIEIRDSGCGIEDVALAREPLFTTDAEGERSGMGFTVMESFSDKLCVSSRRGKGTKVTLIKYIGASHI